MKTNMIPFQAFQRAVARATSLALPLLLLVTMGTQATASAVATPKPKPGYLVAYSQQGRFNSVKIQATNDAYTVEAGKPALKCGGSFSATSGNHIYTRSLPTTRSGGSIVPRSLKCTAVAPSNSYIVTFGKNNNFAGGPSVAVDIDENECTYVHPGQQPADGGAVVSNSCPGALSQADTPDRIGATVAVQPTLSKNKRYVTGTVTVTAGENLTRVQCAGNVTVNYAQGKSSGPLALRYVKRTDGGNSYCRAKFNSNTLATSNKLTPGTYSFSADLPQTQYFQASNGSASITIPPRP